MADKKSNFRLDDYVEVPERIRRFKEQFPEGSLQPWEPPEVMDIGGQIFIKYTAAAYRHPDDQRPGVGTAYEQFPGPTPYTRNSELMNAETSAWGRAIVALGIASSEKIASREEVEARRAEQEQVAAEAAQPPSQAQKDRLTESLEQMKALDGSRDWWVDAISPWLVARHINPEEMNSGQFDYMLAKVDSLLAKLKEQPREQRPDTEVEDAGGEDSYS